MTQLKENALQERVANPDFLGISGSRLYGSNRPDSDNDFRGFVLPPYEYLLGIATFKDTEVPGADHKIFGVKRYLELVLKGDPQLTELLFIPEDKIIRITEIGDRILALRPHIISNAIFVRVVGYGFSEWRKARGERLMVDDFTKSEDEVINDIRNVFDPEKDEMDEVIEILRRKKPRKLVPSKKDLGEKRKREFDNYGFGVTSAAHAIRLCQQLTELMQTGKITFPRPNADFLRDLRQGKYTLSQATEVYEAAKAEADRVKKDSVLPQKPNAALVWDEYTQLVKKFVKSDPRFNS